MPHIIGKLTGVGGVEMHQAQVPEEFVGMPERYLDDLVVEVANLQAIKNPKEFLEKLGIDVMEVYIQDTIRARLPLNSIPDGDLYLFTPKEGFRYIKDGANIVSVPTRRDESNGIGELQDVIGYLASCDDANRKVGKPTSVNVLFYNEESKISLERELQLHRFKMEHFTTLNIQKYGAINLYQYKST